MGRNAVSRNSKQLHELLFVIKMLYVPAFIVQTVMSVLYGNIQICFDVEYIYGFVMPGGL